ALAVAGFAAAAGGIEAEAARAPASDSRLAGVREQAPDRIPEADVGGRARARRLADRRLVDLEHARDALPVIDPVDPDQRGRGLTLVARGHLCRGVGQKDVAGERRLAG